MGDKDSLLDQWIRRLKNNPIVAVLLLFGVTIGALASFTGALGKLAELGRPSPPPVVTIFQTRPQEIQRGEKATLEWGVTQAESVAINGSPVSLTGSREIAPAQTVTYELTAHGPGGTASSSTMLRILAPQKRAFCTQDEIDRQSSPAKFDYGFEGGRAWVHIDDDLYCDYCRVVGDEPNYMLWCTHGTQSGLVGRTYESSLIDRGNTDTQKWIDIDGVPNYSRVIGDRIVRTPITTEGFGETVSRPNL